MAESPDGRGVILFGGRINENTYTDRILELHAGAKAWNILDIKLQSRRAAHVVIPLQ